MTGAWLLTGAGVLAVALGMFVWSGIAVPSRVELYRSVTQRRQGSAGAAVLLAHGTTVRARAWTIAIVGAILAGLGAAGALAPVSLLAALLGFVLGVLPALAIVGLGVAGPLGALWSDGIIEHLVPRIVRRGVTGSGRGRDRPELDSDELSALSGVLDFTERAVREVMTPRTDVVAVREGASLEEVATLFADSGFSRVPVYRDSLDEIVGMIYVFDLLKIAPGAELSVRPVATVPGTKRCTEVLGELQRERRQFAVVLDEYGGTAGIVTLEDLLEELIGEIYDESDGLPLAAGSAGPELVEFLGSTPIDDVRARFSVELPEFGETVGGLLAHVGGRIPRLGDRFQVAGLEFDVLSATPTRVERVVVRRGAPVVIGGNH
ncbi:MAG TPA: hemolysin family protein [Gemmatimonadales bacterium]|jgi:Mg2+/Co2+ transporter CorC